MVYIFIFAVALFTTSCGKGEHSENSAPTEQPDTTLSVSNSEGQQENSNSDSEQSENTNERDASVLKYLVILSCVLSFITLLSTLKMSRRNRRLEKSINNIAYRLGTSLPNIESKISQMKIGTLNTNTTLENLKDDAEKVYMNYES